MLYIIRCMYVCMSKYVYIPPDVRTIIVVFLGKAITGIVKCSKISRCSSLRRTKVQENCSWNRQNEPVCNRNLFPSKDKPPLLLVTPLILLTAKEHNTKWPILYYFLVFVLYPRLWWTSLTQSIISTEKILLRIPRQQHLFSAWWRKNTGTGQCSSCW